MGEGGCGRGVDGGGGGVAAGGLLKSTTSQSCSPENTYIDAHTHTDTHFLSSTSCPPWPLPRPRSVLLVDFLTPEA